MIQLKIISGGQTGADIAGNQVAVSRNISTGGTMPARYRIEDKSGKGSLYKPEYAILYNMKTTTSSGYLLRTRKNVIDSDYSIIFNFNSSNGSKNTRNYCWEYNKDYLYFTHKHKKLSNKILGKHCAKKLYEFISGFGEEREYIVNIAGNRESKYPGINKRVTEILNIMIDEFEKLHKC